MTSVGLFAGIGGVELGFERAGINCRLLCEIDPAAVSILKREFPETPLAPDAEKLSSLPSVDVVAGGFPCQNLSLAGDNSGIHGAKSGLVDHFFRLVSTMRKKPRWLVLENVPFMLWQRKGEAMRHVVKKLEELDYRWAYRVIDARAFGLPQRRRRVIFVASRHEDPRDVLLCDEEHVDYDQDNGKDPCGFFWTEGRAGLGWAVNGVPTLKGGSSIGIVSLPAIWFRSSGDISTPNVLDAERLQGFRANWTKTVIEGKEIRDGFRCKLIGNAVSVPLATWLGRHLVKPSSYDDSRTYDEFTTGVWPNAAFGEKGRVFRVKISEFPKKRPYQSLSGFLKYPVKPLSRKAASGFLLRARTGSLNFAPGFLEAVESHIAKSAN
jgi:DNA (cytosine-5)-methyltransferase 1